MTKFYKGRSDIVFKSVFTKKSNWDLLKKLIEESIDMEVEILEVKATELPKKSIYERGKILDVLVATELGEVNIELNSYSNKYLHRRNASYIFTRYSSSVPVGSDYSKMKNFIQINLTYSKDYDVAEYSCYKLIEVTRGEEFIDNLTIYEFNLQKIKESWYNGDRRHNIMALLDADSKELDSMSKGDYTMNKFKNEVKELNKGLGDIQFMDPDDDAEMIMNTIISAEKEKAAEEGMKIGLEQGRKSLLETAKNLKNMGMNVSDITKATGLSKEVVESIK